MLRQAGLCLALLALLSAGGCSRSHSDNPPHRAIFSPNGEPLSGGPLGFPKCEVAMGGWLDRLDNAHKGAIDRATFLADARRQFKAMDLNGDGALTPEVLLRYREPYSAGVAAQQAARDNESDSDKTGHPGHMKKPGSARTGSGGADIARDVPDPVMSADTSLRLQVTEPVFLQHAGKVFDSLDANHDGQLSRAEALQWCGITAPPESSGGFLGIF
ncbi:MAG TPA: hypothetical protein VN980_09490 [Alphaproteobacteria bacterium]|nr:hypothetical protein [Alphaproteobacteria bacterium]